jgi:hypothetical protein
MLATKVTLQKQGQCNSGDANNRRDTNNRAGRDGYKSRTLITARTPPAITITIETVETRRK